MLSVDLYQLQLFLFLEKMLRRSKVAGFILLITFLFSLYIYKLQSSILDHLPTDFSTFDNVKGSKKLIVPNIIHFIHFDSRTINFVTFICMLSAWYNHKPSKIYLHTNLNLNPRESRYLWVLQSVLGGNLKIHEVQKPTHVFGQKLSSVQHASDVARIKILMKYGGIYLGNMFLTFVYYFFDFECINLNELWIKSLF